MGMKKFEGMEIEEAPAKVVPKCPHCKERLNKIWFKSKGLGWIEQKQIIICPYCESFLSYGSFSWS